MYFKAPVTISFSKTIYLVLLFAATLLFGCKKYDKYKHDTLRHYNVTVVEDAKKVLSEKGSRKANAFIDSFFASFPYISVADKYMYYNLKREMLEMEPYQAKKGDSRYWSTIEYIDSMLLLIEDASLTKIMAKEYAGGFSTARGLFAQARRLYQC